MPLEEATYISGLNASNPLGTGDPKSQGDDHLRLLKSTILATFPAITGAVTATHTELNILAGATLSTAELNILDGVTLSASQINQAAQKDAANTFTATQTIESTEPILVFSDSNAGTNAKNWILDNVSGDFIISATTDAAPTTRVGNAIHIQRSGTTVSSIALAGTAITLNGVNVTDYARLSQANSFVTGQKIVADSASLQFWNEADDARTGYVQAVTSDVLQMVAESGVKLDLYAGGALALSIGSNGNFNFQDGTVTTSKASASEVGTLGVPRVSKTADYTIVAADAGTELVLTSAADDITVQGSGQPAAGTVVFLENTTGGSVDILQGSGMTLKLDGTSTTGSRTLAADGRAYIRFTGSGTASVGGLGVA